MLSFVKHNAASQLPISGNCFLYTKQSLPGATLAATGSPRKATVSVLAHCTDANLQVRTRMHVFQTLSVHYAVAMPTHVDANLQVRSHMHMCQTPVGLLRCCATAS